MIKTDWNRWFWYSPHHHRSLCLLSPSSTDLWIQKKEVHDTIQYNTIQYNVSIISRLVDYYHSFDLRLLLVVCFGFWIVLLGNFGWSDCEIHYCESLKKWNELSRFTINLFGIWPGDAIAYSGFALLTFGLVAIRDTRFNLSLICWHLCFFGLICEDLKMGAAENNLEMEGTLEIGMGKCFIFPWIFWVLFAIPPVSMGSFRDCIALFSFSLTPPFPIPQSIELSLVLPDLLSSLKKSRYF